MTAHEVATPPELEVTLRVRLEEVAGRRLTFGVEAKDGAGVIGRCTHGRSVIDRERFDGSMERKKQNEATRREAGAEQGQG